jgi:hypothetical protein
LDYQALSTRKAEKKLTLLLKQMDMRNVASDRVSLLHICSQIEIDMKVVEGQLQNRFTAQQGHQMNKRPVIRLGDDHSDNEKLERPNDQQSTANFFNYTVEIYILITGCSKK